jgi:hypothetical protein
VTDMLRPEDLKKISDEEDMAKAKTAFEHMKAVEVEQASLREIFMSRDLHPEAKTRINTAVQRAARDGRHQLLAFKFPAAYCNDQGRRINNLAPDWPNSLEGYAKKAYEFYIAELRPLGYKLSAQIFDYPGGMPGDVGFYLSWDR